MATLTTLLSKPAIAARTPWLEAPIAALGSGITAGEEMLSQAADIHWRFFKETLAKSAALGIGKDVADNQVRLWNRQWRNYLGEMLAVPQTGLLRFGDSAYPPTPTTERVVEVAGKPVLLPTRVLKAQQGIAFYTVPHGAAKQFVPASFEPINYGSDTAVLSIFGVSYEESDLGAYEEVGITIDVKPRDAPFGTPGTYTLKLWVNQDFTLTAGREIWGFPKEKAEISSPLAPGASKREWRVIINGVDVISVRFKRGGTRTSERVPVMAYTDLGGNQRLSQFSRSGRNERIRPGGGDTTLTLPAESPITPILRELGLAKEPMMHIWTDDLSGEFHEPYAVRVFA